MSARSDIYRLAVIGLLLSRAPRGVQRVVAYMAVGALLTVAVIVFAVTAHAQSPWTEADGKDTGRGCGTRQAGRRDDEGGRKGAAVTHKPWWHALAADAR
jgi:hypothetical protein